MSAVFGPGGIKPGANALDAALTQLGVRETAPNRGPAVDVYLASVGIDPSAGSFPWCAAFASWCCQQAGLWVPPTASVHALWGKGMSLRVGAPAPGDVAVHLNADGTGHCGVFMYASDGWVTTVDGNTNAEGAREGDRVAIKGRHGSYWHGWIRPATLGANAA